MGGGLVRARFGALQLLDDPLKLVLPLKTIADALAMAEKA